MHKRHCYALQSLFSQRKVCTAVSRRFLCSGLAAIAISTAALPQRAEAEICGLQNAVYDGIFVDGFNSPSSTGLGPAFSTVNAPPTGITPTLSITSPVGSTLAGGHLQVTGTVSGPPNVGVVINGERAYVHNGVFLTRTFTLDVAATQLSAAATAPDGLSVSTSTPISVSSTEPDATLEADAEAGFAPLPVRFSVRLRPGFAATVQNVSVDFSTDGAPDHSGVGPIPLTTYQTPGIYTATADITLSDNSHLIVSRKVIAIDLAEQRTNVCSVYAHLKARLTAQDASGAAQSATGQLRPKLLAFFTALGAQMPVVSTGLGTLADGMLGLDNADVVAVRETGGTLRGYAIHFARDAAGVWRIDAM